MGSKYEFRSLGDLADFSSGGTPSKKVTAYWNGDIPWISAKTLKEDDIYTSNLFITQEGLAAGSKIADAGSLLILTRGSGLFKDIPIGYVAAPVAFNQDIKAISVTAKNQISSRFLFYALKSCKSKISEMVETTGIGAGKLSADRLLSMKLPIPNKEIQQKILSIVRPIDNGISLNNQINDYLAELRNALVKERISNALEQGIGNWRVVPLKNVAQIQSGYSYKSAELVAESSIGMLGIKSFNRNGSFRSDGFKPLKPEKAKPAQYVALGEIVVAHTDLTQNADIIGRAIQVIDSGGYDQMVASLDLVKVTSSDDSISNEFLAALLGTEDFHNHCLGYVNGTTVLHLGKKALPEYQLKIPEDMTIMSELDDAFKSIAQQQAVLIRESRNLERIRDTLLPKLMSGEIDASEVESLCS